MESNTNNGSGKNIGAQRMTVLATLPFMEWKDEDILAVISTQWGAADKFIKAKRYNWVNYTKLYLNQYRKDGSPDKIGSKLLFSKFQETLASFSADDKTVTFLNRKKQDYERVLKCNKVAEFDWEEFQGLDVWKEWMWDTLFYGTGILDVTEYSSKINCIKPKVQNPFLFLFDPLATDRYNMRFCGRYIYMSAYDLMSSFDKEKVQQLINHTLTPTNNGNEMSNLNQQAKNTLLRTDYYEDALTNSTYYECIEWYIRHMGGLYRVWLDSKMGVVLQKEELKYKDGDDGISNIPFIFKNLYSLPRQVLGIGICDLLEDDHRADVQLVNYFFEGIKLDSTPTFLYNYKALMNPRDLTTREIGKNIPMVDDPSGKIIPYPKSQVVNNDTMAFMSMIQNRADTAIGSARILRGSLTDVSKSATEVAVAKSKQDQLIADRVKEMISADKEFWYTYLARYRKYMPSAKKKLVRVVGESGAKEIEDYTKSDFIPEVDPDIKIESKLVSEPMKVLARRDMSELYTPIIQAGGNAKEVVRNLLRLNDINCEDIDAMIPPTPDEMQAEQENDSLNEGKVTPIHEADMDLEHINVHYRADDNDARARHIQAHIYAYLAKKLPPVDPQLQIKGGNPQVSNIPTMPQATQINPNELLNAIQPK